MRQGVLKNKIEKVIHRNQFKSVLDFKPNNLDYLMGNRKPKKG